MQPRFNNVGVIIGGRGTGKTLYVLGSKFTAREEDKKLNIPSVIDLQLRQGFKVLIIDTLDHPSYRKIKILSPAEFLKFKGGVARVYMNPDKVLKLVDEINTNPKMNNTFFIFEDAGKYTEYKLPPTFKRLIADSKQRNIDVLFIYHCWSDTPNDVFKKGCDFIQLFKTTDGPEIRKSYLPEFEMVNSAFLSVKSNSSRFATKFINTSTQ